MGSIFEGQTARKIELGRRREEELVENFSKQRNEKEDTDIRKWSS